tara:strand:+ start:1538 stop:1885 length:348 start_codon:yes stop_codon:yes gene_type:complete
MHLKNFSMVQTSYSWKLASAYNLFNVLIVTPDDQEEVALTIASKKKKISKKIFIEFGVGLGLSRKQFEGVFKRFLELKPGSKDLIEFSFLSEDMQDVYVNILEQRYQVLFNEKKL